VLDKIANEKLLTIQVDASCLDFRRPDDFFHDVNSVASVLKQFLRDLPESLLSMFNDSGS
jgi:hypothetical protein